MTIESNTFLYEILYRGGPDGFRGAHAINLQRVSDGDNVLVDRQEDARPITEAEFRDLLGGESAALIEAADAARAALASAEQAKAAAEASAEEALSQAAATEAFVASLRAEAASLRVQLDNRAAQLDGIGR